MQMMNLKEGAIERMVSKQEGRLGLTEVYFDAQKGTLAATDGHGLVVAHVHAEKGESSGYIPAAALIMYRQLAAKVQWNPRMVGIFAFKDEVLVECPLEKIRISYERSTKGQFPDIRRVIPRVEGPPTITFDAQLLAQLTAAIGFDEQSKSVSIWVTDADKPMLVKTTPFGAIGVLMPMKPGGVFVTSLEELDQHAARLKPGYKSPKQNVTEMPASSPTDETTEAAESAASEEVASSGEQESSGDAIAAA